ncbi:hypothetical protein IV498_11495 [Paenarthrobacter sp. Z7-10]|uniref:hypothetical protein n=1 Tax=Paenarthrobacter sp. Z7-10 TaxID=2787635 RepID=UPI0022A9781D|nr:hypothetical protein [Paenarthrobacter sp. Z7-10]MCZ2403793.1 hypothetical protein [Paenarthrobacter sp. Z7-10]
MAERGNTTHSPQLDDKMKQETQAMTQGNQPGHVEEWRETEPMPDDTDPEEVRQAMSGTPDQEAEQEEGTQ